MDGEQVLDIDGLKFVTNNKGIDSLFFNTFHGGDTKGFLPDRDGYPVFCQRRSVKYMQLKSGVEHQYSAVQIYQEYLDYVAAGFVQGEAREDIENEYYLTLSLIKEFSNINLKENKVYQLSEERIVA